MSAPGSDCQYGDVLCITVIPGVDVCEWITVRVQHEALGWFLGLCLTR